MEYKRSQFSKNMVAASEDSNKKADTEEFEAPPDTSLMSKMGRTGYSLSEFVAEFVDNSLDERVDEVPLVVDVEAEGDKLSIRDNAGGMDKPTLKKAITIAHSTKKGKLGEYGMGMKSAAVGLGQRFVIDTTRVDANEAYRLAWDEEEWAKTKEWKYHIQTLPKNGLSHGTVIQIHRLRVKVGNKITTLRAELGRRFGPYIRRGLITLRVNGNDCKAPELKFLAEDGLKVPNPFEFHVKTKKGHRVHGSVALLQHASIKGLYGFDTFRHGRMITFYDKVGFSAHPTVARIVGELHMDHVPVTHNKREWMKTDALYDDAVAAVKEAIGDHIREARRLSSQQKVLKSVELSRLEKFKEGLGDAFQSEDLKDYTSPERTAKAPKDPTTVADPDGNLEITVQGKEYRDKGSSKGTNPPTGTGSQRKPKKIDMAKNRKLRVKGRVFDYDHKWGDLGEDGPWMDFNWDDKKRLLEIISNKQSPIFHATKDTTIIAFLHIVDAISQVLMQESDSGWEKYDEIRHILLQHSTKHVAELQQA